MIRPKTLAFVTVLAALAAAGGCGGERVVIDLIETFPTATKRPAPDVFEIVQATVKGETRPAILVKHPSRIIWKIEVPQKAWLKVGAALREDAWTIAGDGVMFNIRVTYNKGGQAVNEELASFLLNPYSNNADREWHDLQVDLSNHGGTAIELIFNTLSSYSPPGAPGRDDRAGDFPLWGAPRITAR